MAKAELTDNQASEVKAALLKDGSIVNPSGGVLIMDPRVPGYFRKATAEEAREHDNDIDEVTAAARKTPAGTDNP